MRSIFGEGVSLDGETFPLPEIRFAALRKFRPSLKGRVVHYGLALFAFWAASLDGCAFRPDWVMITR
jgi:hypothetical protein